MKTYNWQTAPNLQKIVDLEAEVEHLNAVIERLKAIDFKLGILVKNIPNLKRLLNEGSDALNEANELLLYKYCATRETSVDKLIKRMKEASYG